MTLTPAYGRDYNSKKAFLIDLNEDKDFMLNNFDGGGLVNLSQLREMGLQSIQIRWKKLTQTTIVKLPREGEVK